MRSSGLSRLSSASFCSTWAPKDRSALRQTTSPCSSGTCPGWPVLRPLLPPSASLRLSPSKPSKRVAALLWRHADSALMVEDRGALLAAASPDGADAKVAGEATCMWGLGVGPAADFARIWRVPVDTAHSSPCRWPMRGSRRGSASLLQTQGSSRTLRSRRLHGHRSPDLARAGRRWVEP